MREFVASSQGRRVVFGLGAMRHLGREIDAMGVSRALLLCTPGRIALCSRAAETAAGLVAGICSGAVMHVPLQVAQSARAQAQRIGADCLVAVGGGSTIGLAKAVALEMNLPILALPTTYSGSEMTPIYGITEGNLKKTGRDPRVQPRCVIYDPELGLNLPFSISVNSAMNAIAHAAEGLYAQDRSDQARSMAEEGIAAMASALPALQIRLDSVEARSEALYGAWLCGSVLGQVGMALHHKLCHVLGASFNLPHAEVHSVILPYVLAFNAAAAPEAMAVIMRALGRADCGDAAQAMYQFSRELGAAPSLLSLGMKADDLDRAAELAVQNPYWNPRPLGAAARGEIRSLLQRAYLGLAPQAVDSGAGETAL